MPLEIKTSLPAAVLRLERDLLKMPQADIKTTHSFPPGQYIRSVTIPPWTVLTGAEHLTDYTVRLEKGTIAVNTDDGMAILEAPLEFHAKAGCKRVGRVFEHEVVWTDIYDNPDNCRDLAVLEARLYDLSASELGETRAVHRIDLYRRDYTLFLAQMGMTQEQMGAIVQIEEDLIDMPPGFAVELRPSAIHGTGLFATAPIDAGHPICPGRLGGCRTTAGRFINHSPEPNTTSHMHTNGDIWAVALHAIQENEEITIDYRTSMRVNFGIEIKGEKPCQVG
jgi:hypothetical protein